MSNHDDDEYSYRHDLNSENLGNSVRENMRMDHDGNVQVFNWSIPVGPELAPILSPVIEQVVTNISTYGAKYARHYGTEAAEKFLAPHHAAKVGKAAYLTWMFGLPVADVSLGIKKTVQGGFKEMYALRDQAEPLLAANNNANVSLSSALTSKFTVLANARARIREDSMRKLTGTLAEAVRVVPNIWMGIYKNQLDNIQHPALVREASIHPGMKLKERRALRAQLKDLELKQAKDPKTGQRINLGEVEGPAQLGDNILRDLNGSKFKFHAKPRNEREYHDNLQALKWAPALAGVAGEVMKKRISGKERPEVAWDKIMELQHLVHQHTHPDQEAVAVMVKEIFIQHARDEKKRYDIEGDPLNKTADLIAAAIVQNHLHPQAIAEMLDNTKIVSFGKTDVDFGEPAEIKEQLSRLVIKYNGKIGEKEVYKNAPFTKKTLPETYKNISPEEKPFFTALFPLGVLERAGVPKDEVEKNRAAFADQLQGELVERLRLALTATPEELKAQGVKNKYIDALQEMKHQFTVADSDGEAAQYVSDNMKDVTKLMRNVEASVKKPGEMWKEFVARNNTPGAGMPDAANDPHIQDAANDPGFESRIVAGSDTAPPTRSR